MRTSLLRGLLLALFGALTIGLGQLFGLELDHVALLGVAVGGALSLVPGGSWERLAGFGVGFVVAWLGFAARAVLLPDSATGRAAAVFAVLAILAVAVAVMEGRLPLWSCLLGVAAIVGAYEESYTAAPSQFLAQSTTAATTVLFAAALGFLASSLFPDDSATHGVQGPRHQADEGFETTDRGSLDDILTGESK